MHEHSIARFASDLSAKLATRSRHVSLLLGAGASRPCGLPDVATLSSTVVAALPTEHGQFLQQQLERRSFEATLSRLRKIASLLPEATETIDGITGLEAAQIDRKICQAIGSSLSVEKADLKPMLQFATWLGRTDYHLPVEVFTLNYDLLLESALDAMGVAYFDGFVGNLTGRFRTDYVGATPEDTDIWLPSFLVRLWKLHGSVNWVWSQSPRTEVVRLGSSVSVDDAAAAIYPSDQKYEQSRRTPFLALHDRFRRALEHPESLTLISGYSFGDEHLNEVIFDQLVRQHSGHPGQVALIEWIAVYRRSCSCEHATATSALVPSCQRQGTRSG